MPLLYMFERPLFKMFSTIILVGQTAPRHHYLFFITTSGGHGPGLRRDIDGYRIHDLQHVVAIAHIFYFGTESFLS